MLLKIASLTRLFVSALIEGGGGGNTGGGGNRVSKSRARASSGTPCSLPNTDGNV